MVCNVAWDCTETQLDDKQDLINQLYEIEQVSELISQASVNLGETSLKESIVNTDDWQQSFT